MDSRIAFIGAAVVLPILMFGIFSLFSREAPRYSVSQMHHRIPPGADMKTFKFLCTGAYECGYSKDKNHVYYDGVILQGVDPKTFKIIDQFYAKDAKHVYYSDPKVSNAPIRVDGDPTSFRNLGGNKLYTADNYAVYWNNIIIPGADPATFVTLYDGITATVYGKDDTTVYHAGAVVQGADPVTFHIVATAGGADGSGADGYGADENHVYINGTVVPNANPDTFVPPPPQEIVTPPSDTGAGNTQNGGSATSTGGTTENTGGAGSTGSAGSSYGSNYNNYYYGSGGTGVSWSVTGNGQDNGPVEEPVYPNGIIKDPNGF